MLWGKQNLGYELIRWEDESYKSCAPQHPRDHGNKTDLGNQLQHSEVSAVMDKAEVH